MKSTRNTHEHRAQSTGTYTFECIEIHKNKIRNYTLKKTYKVKQCPDIALWDKELLEFFSSTPFMTFWLKGEKVKGVHNLMGQERKQTSVEY